MGQYYRIVNIDKQEVMKPFDFGNGMKLMEWSYGKNYMVLALMNLLTDEWYGDRVYVIGDYADNEDPEECWAPTFAAIGDQDIYNTTDSWLHRVPIDHSICQFRENYENTEDVSIEDWHYRFIYNRMTKQVIDLDKCPIEWTWYDKETGEVGDARVSPLPLLLAMGNGRGGGDFRNPAKEDMVGSWCATSQYITITETPLPDDSEYTDFNPDFTEHDPVIPYTKLDEELAKNLNMMVS